MEILEIENFTWEIPKIIVIELFETNSGAANVPPLEGVHDFPTTVLGVS